MGFAGSLGFVHEAWQLGILVKGLVRDAGKWHKSCVCCINVIYGWWLIGSYHCGIRKPSNLQGDISFDVHYTSILKLWKVGT